MFISRNPRELAIADYTYDLPESRIASFPLADRDAAKLLVYKNGEAVVSQYRQLADFIPEDFLLVFNKTKVVSARLFFTKPTGAAIEIFCLEPHPTYPDITRAMLETGTVRWNCLVGGANKWTPGLVLEKKHTGSNGAVTLSAEMENRTTDSFTIRFSWSPATLSFAEILQEFGVIPIPPYLNRETNAEDTERYQTIYAEANGSVAAPTAGLHFTDQLFSKLREKLVRSTFVTLHVGAGTFKPVKSDKISGHEMHAEFMEVDVHTIEELLGSANRIIAVGTTSLRTLESLYWMGVKAFLHPHKKLNELKIGQWDVYDELMAHDISVEESLNTLLDRMKAAAASRLICKTQIMIAPSYPIKMVKALITNFHQPQSTLLLLVAAMIGPKWKDLYKFALENDFRFLSYGDGSLLWYDQA